VGWCKGLLLAHSRTTTCRYPADRVPSCTRFKSRQRAERATTHRHVSRNIGTCLPTEVGSEAAKCPVAPEPPPPEREGSGATMCTIASDPLGELRCATCPEASDPASLRGGLRDPVMPVIPYGPHASNMKKSLAGLPVQQGSLVPNAHVHVSRHLTSRPSCACKTCG
jgi:hypothetical protein